MKSKLVGIGVLVVGLVIVAYAQDSTKVIQKGWINELDVYAKVFGAVLTGLATLLGLPLVALNFKKTQAEIRKLEKEAAAIENSNPIDQALGTNFINVSDVIHSTLSIQILADPRFLSPLLLLLDFIIAWAILTIISYLISTFLPSIISDTVSIIAAGILLIPILQETIRVRKELRKVQREQNASEKKQE